MMVFHGLLTKGKPLEARYQTKDLNGKPGGPRILTKIPLNVTFAICLSPIFLRFLKLVK